MITLSSDFGSPYPAAMKGAILRRSNARIVDVSHDLPRQDVRAAGFWLRFTLPEFPPAVHCAVVDPGVGTGRNAIVIRAGEHALVGPDNGSLVPPARALAASAPNGEFEVFVHRPDDPASSTFHGRDVFAPLAAEIHEAGIAAVESLPDIEPADSFVDLQFPQPEPLDSGGEGVLGEVLVVDDFGNAITNVPGDVAEGFARAVVNGARVPVVETFADVEPGDPLLTVGSHGYLECDVREGRGDEAFDLRPGAQVTVQFPADPTNSRE